MAYQNKYKVTFATKTSKTVYLYLLESAVAYDTPYCFGSLVNKVREVNTAFIEYSPRYNW